jgi:protein phosphatase PTC1
MKDFVTADPYLSETRFSDYKECPLLILACDGVWDVMTDQEAVDFILEATKQHGGPFEGAAQMLVLTAIERGSADNITAIVIFL